LSTFYLQSAIGPRKKCVRYYVVGRYICGVIKLF